VTIAFCQIAFNKDLSIVMTAQTMSSTIPEIYTVSQKTVKNCFCQNLVKFPSILIIFSRMMTKLCEVHSFSTPPNLRHHTTVLNADVPNCYTKLKVVSIRLLTFASSVR